MFFSSAIEQIDDFLWTWLALPALLLAGGFLTIYLKVPQITDLPSALREFWRQVTAPSNAHTQGVSPLRAFFTSIGGCIGVANLVTVCSILVEAGPGAVFWMWVAAFLGMVVKYSEIYLSVKLRQRVGSNYLGGGMWLIQRAFPTYPFLATLFAGLFCVYGTEIYMFQQTLDQSKPFIASLGVGSYEQPLYYFFMCCLIGGILYTASGGVDRVGQWALWIVPTFMCLFMGASIYVLWTERAGFGTMVQHIFYDALHPQIKQIGGGVMSAFFVRMQKGFQRGCYSGDIGVGYAGMIHAQTKENDPRKAARMGLVEICIDTLLLCTLTLFVVSITLAPNYIPQPDNPLIAQAFKKAGIPYTEWVIPLLIVLVAYSTLISFFLAGLSSARYLSKTYGKQIYMFYGASMFALFTILRENPAGLLGKQSGAAPIFEDIALKIMSIFGAFLLLIQLLAILKLARHLKKNN